MGLQTIICEGQSANAVIGPLKLKGDHVMAVSGVLGGATLSFYHKMAMPSDPETTVELPRDSEMTFTALPAPFPYMLSEDLPLYLEITGASGTTDLNIMAYKIKR